MKKETARTVTAFVLVGLLSGCIFQQEPKTTQGTPYPDPSAKTQQKQRDVGQPKAETAISANAVDVTLTQSAECRDETPMVRDVTTERQANTMWQVINGGGAVLFGGLGAYALAGDCTVTPDPTASNQNPASRPCTSKEEGQATALGVGLVATGALFGAAFIYNVIKARDSKETVPVRVARDWGACGTRPVAGASLHLDLVDGQQVVQTTNAQGQAHFDLTTIRWTDDALKEHQARLASGGQELATVDLSKLPQYVAWQAAQEAKQALARAGLLRQEYYALLDTIDARLDNAEKTVKAMEKMREPFTPSSAEGYKTLAEQLQTNNPGTTFNQWRVVGEQLLDACRHWCAKQGRATECGDNSPVLISCVKPAANLTSRINGGAARAKDLGSRMQALTPRTNRAAAVLRAQNEALATALLQAMLSGGGGSSSASTSSSSPATERDDERRRQQAESERYSRQQDCERKCRYAESSCTNGCPPTGINQLTEDGRRCWATCQSNRQTCEASCAR